MILTAGCIVYEGYSRCWPCRSEPYRIISLGPDYSDIDLNGTQNTDRATNRWEYPREKLTIQPVQDPDIEDGKPPPNRRQPSTTSRKSCKLKTFVPLEHKPTNAHNFVLCYGYRLQHEMGKPSVEISFQSREVSWWKLRNVYQKRMCIKNKRTVSVNKPVS